MLWTFNFLGRGENTPLYSFQTLANIIFRIFNNLISQLQCLLAIITVRNHLWRKYIFLKRNHISHRCKGTTMHCLAISFRKPFESITEDLIKYLILKFKDFSSHCRFPTYIVILIFLVTQLHHFGI